MVYTHSVLTQSLNHSLTRAHTHSLRQPTLFATGVDTFEWVQKRGRVLTAELDDDIGYQSMNNDDIDYSGR